MRSGLAFVYVSGSAPADPETWRPFQWPGTAPPWPIPDRPVSSHEEGYTGPELRPGNTRLEDGRELVPDWRS